jgi:hypothetical protein
LKGWKTVGDCIFCKGQRYTTIAAIDITGLVCDPLIIKGGCDMETFLSWFQQDVVGVLDKLD